MALTKGTNSYATIVEADTYFSDRLDVAAWTASDNTLKAQALVTASQILDDLSWTGMAISETQPLAFPRTGYYFDPRIGTHITLDGNTVPTRVINATYELAYHILNNDGILDDTGQVKNLQVGSVNLGVIKAPSLVPMSVRRMIKPLLVNAGSNSWWRAN
jgi:hypothetical protein